MTGLVVVLDRNTQPDLVCFMQQTIFYSEFR